MYRVIDEYMAKVHLTDDAETRERLDNFLRNAEELTKYSLTVHYEKYSVDMQLPRFSVEEAGKLFRKFMTWVSYDYSAFFIRFVEENCVRYRYLTCKPDKTAIYCDIIIR